MGPRRAIAAVGVGLALGGPAAAGEIHEAARRGDLARVERLCTQRPASVREPDAEGFTPLHFAAFAGHVPVVTYLLDHGADVQARPPERQNTPLHEAAYAGQREVIELLLARGADLGAVDKDRCTPLMYAAFEKATPTAIDLLVAKGAKIDATNGTGERALHIAARGGNVGAVDALLAAGADLEAKGFEDETPLLAAARCGNLPGVTRLLEKGANLKARARKGETALHRAAYNGHVLVAEKLLDAGLGPDLMAKDKSLAIHDAALGGQAAMIRLLVARKSPVSPRMEDQFTPLILAVQEGHLDAITALVECKADLKLANKNGYMAIHSAAWNGQAEAAALLIAKGAKVDERTTSSKETALQVAIKRGHRNVLEVLLEKGADVNVKGPAGHRPLHDAAIFGKADLCELLLSKGADVNAKTDKGLTAWVLAMLQPEVRVVLARHGAKTS